MNTTKAKEFFKKLSDKFLDLLYPEGLTCVNCGDELQHETRLNLCGKCYLNLIENDGHRCKICGIRMKNEADYCDNCTRFDKYFDMNRSPFIYEKTASDLVKKLKFGNKLYIAKELAKAMADEYFTGGFNCDFILYVPMTEKEEKERGYNQSELLAKEVGLRTGLSVFDNLKKVKETDIDVKVDTMVTEIRTGNVVVATNNTDGLIEIAATAIVLAMGCRERPRGALDIPGSRQGVQFRGS